MSSMYSRMKQLRALPSHAEYAAAHVTTEELLADAGKTVWDDTSERFARVRLDAALAEKFQTLMGYGSLLQEDILTDTPRSDRPSSSLVGRAFALGFMQQLPTTGLVYANDFSLVDAINAMNVQYNGQNLERFYDPDDSYGTRQALKQFNSQYIYALGEWGVASAGKATETHIDTWSREVYYADDRLAKAFRLGNGALIVCAMKYQQALNERLITFASQHVNLDEEARAVFSPNTSEEQ